MPNNLNKITGVSPAKANSALLILDMVSDFEFTDGGKLFANAIKAAANLARLRERARKSGVPVIFVNDNFGKWEKDFSSFVRSIVKSSEMGKRIVEVIGPGSGDYHILKPQRSGFYGTPLEVLLLTMNVSDLIITGVTTDICVLFTAHDAYMRGYELQVPSDCTAAVTAAYHKNALSLMKRVVYAKTVTGDKVKFKSG